MDDLLLQSMERILLEENSVHELLEECGSVLYNLFSEKKYLNNEATA